MRRRLRVVVLVWASALAMVVALGGPVESQGPSEAPTGFDLVSNGFAEEFCANQAALTDSPNSPQIPPEECSFDTALEEFTGPETVADGLGPIFNAAGCGECHVVPAIGGTSQIAEKRAGFFNGSSFIEHPGGSLIQDRALDPSIQELALPAFTNVTAFRATISVFGDGFVEAVGNTTLDNIRLAQPTAQRGQLISVPVLEKPNTTRFGRFGWKDQHASLVSFSADAYKNEMGITSPLEPVEPSSNGNSIAAFDTVPDPDDEGVDVELFALFMRSTKAPPRDAVRAAQSDAIAGSNIFNNIGCGTCHTRNITTSSPGTLINGGALRVTNALGNKVIHPFSDFMLHDIGTGDGIVQNGGASTRLKVRTAALWGVRARGRLMHDFLSLNLTDAIARHGGQASTARSNFNALSSNDKNRVFAFLLSL